MSDSRDTRYGKNPFPCKRLHGFSANGAAPRGGGLGWVGRGEPGWVWGLAGRVRLRRGRCKYVPVSSVAASMRLTPLRSPTRPASDTFRRFRPPRKEIRRAKAKAAFRVAAGVRSLPHTQGGIYRVDQGRHLPEIAIYPPSPGNCRRRGGVGWRGVRGMDAAAKPPGTGSRRPRHPTPPRLPTGHPRAALALASASAGAGRSPAKKKAAFRRPSLLITSV